MGAVFRAFEGLGETMDIQELQAGQVHFKAAPAGGWLVFSLKGRDPEGLTVNGLVSADLWQEFLDALAAAERMLREAGWLKK